MSRPRTFSRPFTVRFHPLELALVHYYADKHNTEPPEVMRLIVKAYAKADKNLDLDDFARYVASDFSKRDENSEIREVAVRQVNEYVESRKGGTAPTVTMTRRGKGE
jgi:hypothetical protein